MKLINTAKRYGAQVVAGSAALVASVQSFAETGALATAATAELAGAKTDVTSIATVIIGIVCVIAVGGIIAGMVMRKGK